MSVARRPAPTLRDGIDQSAAPASMAATRSATTWSMTAWASITGPGSRRGRRALRDGSRVERREAVDVVVVPVELLGPRHAPAGAVVVCCELVACVERLHAAVWSARRGNGLGRWPGWG